MDEAVAKIQATISGYSGRPCSLLSIYDKEHRIIVISKIAPYRDKPVDGASVITNVPNIQREAFFAESDMKEAIQHFKTLHGMVPDSSLMMGSDAQTRPVRLSPTASTLQAKSFESPQA